MFSPGDQIQVIDYLQDRLSQYRNQVYTVNSVAGDMVYCTNGFKFGVKDVKLFEPFTDQDLVINLPDPPLAENLDSFLETPEVCPTRVFTVEAVESYVARVNAALQEANEKIELVKKRKTKAPPTTPIVNETAVHNAAIQQVVDAFMAKGRRVSAGTARMFLR